MTPHGQAAKIATLLKEGGDRISFKSLSAGTAVVKWYDVPAGAHIPNAKGRARLIAGGKLTFSHAGKAKLKMKLTSTGRHLLKREEAGHATLLKVTAKGSFKTKDPGAAVLAEKTFIPKR
jgi:hypothetical protein